METAVQLLYCGSNEGYEGILFSLLSAMRRTRRPLQVTLLTAALNLPCGKPIECAKAEYAKGLLQSRKDGSTLRLLDRSAELTDLLAAMAPLPKGVSPYAFLKFFADKTELSGRVLYLDADTLLSGDVGIVFDQGLSDCAFGAVRDAKGSWIIAPDYFNTGVLLFDLERAKKEGLFEKARLLLKEERLYLPHRSAFYYTGVPAYLLPPSCNEQTRLRSDTLVRHFCRQFKLFPLPHLKEGAPFRGYEMRGKEYKHFERTYEEYLLQREGRKAE